MSKFQAVFSPILACILITIFIIWLWNRNDYPLPLQIPILAALGAGTAFNIYNRLKRRK